VVFGELRSMLGQGGPMRGELRSVLGKLDGSPA
jgi:hypothetical protein